MHKLSLLILFLVAVALFVPYEQASAALEGKDVLYRTEQASDGPSRTLVNIGQVSLWIDSDGQSAHDPDNNSGLFYPRGSSPTTAVIYIDGLVWGGQVNDGQDPVIRVGGQTYSVGTQPGRIVSPGVAEKISDPGVNRVWRIRSDWQTADLTLDASEVFRVSAGAVDAGMITQLRDQYEFDWINWPADRGAPFYDADGDGIYNPQFNSDGSPVLYPDGDEPGYAGGDQVVWIITNDLSDARTSALYGSPPIGMEMALTLWAYRRSDALGNIIFKEYSVVYKGTATTPANATIDSLFFCQFSDPDLGSYGDDFVASDTTLSLGYAYNSSSQDNTFSAAGFPPPAAGYDFFAGPIVAQEGGTAIFNLQRRDGFINLPMTTFAFFAAGQEDEDPDLKDYAGTLQWWNLLRGFKPRPESPPTPWTDPSGNPTKFRVPGDPVAGTGWLDENPGDRRLLMASGPFTMAVGDTNQTVVSVIAALGSDRLSSVSVLKFYDRFAQEAFDNLFELPKAPPSPALQATPFSGEILLNWGYDQAAVEKVEQFDDKGFLFEGYNLYQLPSAGADISQGIKLATYDVVNEATVITQEEFDDDSGLILELPVQQGKNSGLQRFQMITTDRFREKPLADGQEYYFGITAYSFNPDPTATIKSLESPVTVVAVVPQTLKPGVRLSQASGDTLQVSHEGPGDGNVVPMVVDATKLTGDNYSVTFNDDGTWNLLNSTKGDTVLKNQVNQSGDDNYLVVDGMLVKVIGPPPGINSIVELNPNTLEVADANLWVSLNNYGRSQQWPVIVVTATSTTNLSDIDRFGLMSPKDYDIIFTEDDSTLLWNYFTDAVLKDATTGEPQFAPFTFWRIDLDGSRTRLPVTILDADEDGTWNRAWDGVFGPAYEPLYVYDNAAYDPALVDDYIAADNGTASPGYGPWGVNYPAVNRFTIGMYIDVDGYATPDQLDENGYFLGPPAPGEYIRVITNKPNSPVDTYTFSSQSPTTSKDLALQDVEKINVFPNPYYGFHRAEENRFQRFVTFNHLPQKATMRVFTIAGDLVRTIEKDDETQFARWDLQNENQLPVASGMYLVHIDMPDLGVEKILKVAVIREEQFLPNF